MTRFWKNVAPTEWDKEFTMDGVSRYKKSSETNSLIVCRISRNSFSGISEFRKCCPLFGFTNAQGPLTILGPEI